MKSQKSLQIISFVLVGALWVIVALLAAEIILRATSKYKISRVVYDPQLGWRYKYNMRYRKAIKNLSKQYYHFTTNSRGFRDREHKLFKGENTQRIMFLGDSYTVGEYVSDERVFTRLFERMVGYYKKDAIKFEVMSVAVGAWATDQHFLYFKDEGVHYKPDYLFLMVAPNDIRETYVRQFFQVDNQQALQRKKTVSLPRKIRLYWSLSNNSFVYQFLQKEILKTDYGTFANYSQYFPVAWNIENSPTWDHPLFLKNTPDKVKKARSLFEAILLEINRSCLKNNCTLVLVILPTKMEFDGQLEDDLYQPGNVSKYVRDFALKYNINFLDLYSVLKRQKDPLKIFISDEFHLNSQGHFFVAQNIYNFFINLGILKDS
ncbi:MAG: SGNH/GDSL hydrolase family protein [Candidatus Omnitrophota bacterium]